MGSTAFVVDDASTFRIGDELLAFSGNAYSEQSHSAPSNSHVVTGITGNTIMISPAVSKVVSAGKVQLVSDQVRTFGDVKSYNTVFDGNSQEMNATNSWVHMTCILSYIKGLHIENCKFLNMPSDVIIVPSELWMDNCYIENLYGSFVHGSSSYGQGTFESAGFYLKNIKGRDICKVPAAVNGHSAQYGFYTQSIGTNNIMIDGCNIQGGNYGGIVTPLTGASDKISLNNNYFEGFSHICNNISTTDIQDFRITNNTFANCGVLNFLSSVHGSGVYNRVTIADNTFTNCQLAINGTDKMQISNNQFYYIPDTQFIDFTTSKETFPNSRYGIISTSASNAIITDNMIYTTAYDNRALCGIYVVVKNNNSFENCLINNNQIIGFRRGIYTLFQGTQTLRQNFTISSNIIQTQNYAQSNADYAIQSGHGARILNNIIKHNVNKPAIKVYGTLNVNHPIANIISGNIIEGTNYGRQIELNYYHSLVNNNTLTGGIGFTSGSYASRNIIGLNHTYSLQGYNTKHQINFKAFISGNGPPTTAYPKGSIYTDELTGNQYLFINNTWKKISVQ